METNQRLTLTIKLCFTRCVNDATTPIRTACQVLGSQSRLAVAIGVTASMVNQLVAGTRPVPVDLAIAIERETAGAVTVEELRPDVDWAVIRGKPAVPGREAA